MKQSVLITGASSGIGRAAALRFAERGYLVFAAARRLHNLQELAQHTDGTIVPVALDVRDASSIENALEIVKRHAPQGIDVLVNNAGYALVGPIETLASSDIRDQYDTNVFGLLEVTRAVLPAMRAKRAGCIINVSSLLGRMALVGSGAYCSSKFAVEAISDALRMELAPFGIRVIVVEPGFTTTDIDLTPRTAGPAIGDYETTTAAIGAYGAREQAKGTTPDKVATAIANAARRRRPRARYVVPRHYSALLNSLKFIPSSTTDTVMRRMVLAAAKK